MLLESLTLKVEEDLDARAGAAPEALVLMVAGLTPEIVVMGSVDEDWPGRFLLDPPTPVPLAALELLLDLEAGPLD